MAKYSGFTVALDKEVDGTQAELIRTCILMIQGVADVTSIESDLLTESIAKMSLKNEIREKLYNFIQENL